MSNYKLYQNFLRTSTRHERRKVWIGTSPVYIMRLRQFKELAQHKLDIQDYSGYNEYNWLKSILEYKEKI